MPIARRPEADEAIPKDKNLDIFRTVLYTMWVGNLPKMFAQASFRQIPKEEKMKIARVLISVMLLVCAGNAGAFAQEEKGDIMVLKAEIVFLDHEAGTLVVEGYEETGDLAGKEIMLNVSGETVIFFEDEEIDLYDLMTGDSVTIEHYTGASGEIFVTKIHLEYNFEGMEEDIYDFE
jgi:hypothetical protein